LREEKYRVLRCEWGQQLELILILQEKKSGVVVEDVIVAAICLEAHLGDCPAWRRWHFPSNVKLLTEWEGAKGTKKMGVSMVDMAFYALRRHYGSLRLVMTHS